MQNKISKILFSTRLTAILFIVYAAAMAIGTFLDAGQTTSPTAYTRNLIYNAWWFEAIMVNFNSTFSLHSYFVWRIHYQIYQF
jgi:hypothetical protein